MCGIGLVWHGSNSCDERDQETFKVVPVDTGQMCRDKAKEVFCFSLSLSREQSGPPNND